MKKSIAILLVLVIATVGLFADTAAMQVKTTIIAASEVVITADNPGFSNPTYEDFSALTAIADAVAVDKASTTIGYLNFFTNKTTGLTATFTATKLADNDATSPVSTTIGYTVTVNGVSKDAAAGASAPITLVATGQTGTTIATLPITIDLVDDDYDTAAVAKGLYVADIVFTYTAN